MVLSVYWKQRIVQLYFERRLSYANVAKVLAAEGYIVSKQTGLRLENPRCMEASLVFQEMDAASS